MLPPNKLRHTASTAPAEFEKAATRPKNVTPMSATQLRTRPSNGIEAF
jgi:hypothetical protein